MAGRSTILNEEIAQRIIEALEQGNTFRTAAQAAGIDQSTLHEWRAKGREGQEPYAEFAERVKKAQASAEKAYVAIVNKAANASWQAAAWWLERRRHKSYGRKDRVDTRVSHIETMSDADLARKHKALLEEANKEFSDGEAEANKRARGG